MLTSYVTIVHFSKLRKLTLIQNYDLTYRIYSLSNYPTNDFSLLQDPVQHHPCFVFLFVNLEHFLCLSLTFMSQLFCRMPLSLGLSDVPL